MEDRKKLFSAVAVPPLSLSGPTLLLFLFLLLLLLLRYCPLLFLVLLYVVATPFPNSIPPPSIMRPCFPAFLSLSLSPSFHFLHLLLWPAKREREKV